MASTFGALAGRVHDRSEEGFARLGEWICDHAILVICASLAFTIGLTAGLPRLRADFKTDNYLLPGDDTRQRYDAFRDEFGLDERIVVALEPADVFDPAFLTLLREMHEEIERDLPYIEDVLSLVNARNTRGESDTLIVEDLLEVWPSSVDDLVALRERVIGNEAYRGVLISPDGRIATILIQPETYSSLGDAATALAGFESDGQALGQGEDEPPEFLTAKEQNALIEALLALVDRYAREGLRIDLVGGGVIGHHTSGIAARDSMMFTALSLGSVPVVLFLLFRRLSGALLSVVVVALALASSFGAIGWLGIPFGHPMQILPNLLIAVGICDSVHILTIFNQRIDLGEGPIGPEDRRIAIVHALRHSGLAVVLTSLTTAAGMFSFLAAEITPVSWLGVVAPIGVGIALLYGLLMLPALLFLVPLRGRARLRAVDPRTESRTVAGWLQRIGSGVTSHPRLLLLAVLVLIVVASDGISRLRVSHDLLEWLRPDDALRLSVEHLDSEMGGLSTIEALIDSGEKNGLYSPALLSRIDAAAGYAVSLERGPVSVGSALSIVEIVKEINRALHSNDPARYHIPDDRALIAQELLLFDGSGSEDLEVFADAELRTARMTLRVPIADAFHYGPFLEELEAGLHTVLGPGVGVELTGETLLINRAFAVVVTSLVRSYLLALLIITPLMILVIGELRLGLLSMLPNLLPVYLTLALMGWLDYSLNLSTLLTGSVIIGLAVDDTIHFMHRFARERRCGAEVDAAIHATLGSTGHALFITSAVLCVCFGLFSFGHMPGIVRFGLLAVFGISVAFLADITVSPALVKLAERNR